MSAHDEARRQQREGDRAERDRNRRLRHTALRTLAALAQADDSLTGATLILPDGSAEYVDAAPLRQGGRA